VQGFTGPAINGNLAVYGYVHCLKQNYTTTQVALNLSCTSCIYNDYTGQAKGTAGTDVSDIIWQLGGKGDEDQLCARVKIKSGQLRMQILMDANSQGSLEDANRSELEALVVQGQRLSVRKARAAALLTERGYPVTRAALRGRFIRTAKARRRDYTVDWVHLKLNDQAQRTVLCKDPFRYEDERVDRLIAAM
jgi:hypothetical protein